MFLTKGITFFGGGVGLRVVQDFELPYDYLVVSVGATSNTFGTPGVKEHCIFLKQVQDAQKLRKVTFGNGLLLEGRVRI